VDLSVSMQILLTFLLFVVAALYSSVGHGGASGYLAILSLFSVPTAQMSGTALILNVVVASLASYAFIRAGHFSLRITWPFALTSIPMAFVGGLLKTADRTYFLLLAIALLVAAFRLSVSFARHDAPEETRVIKLAAALPTGGAIGLLSGIVGVGGGIFLSPVLILLRWATTKQAAATAAVFILVNSLAGLAGRMVRGHIVVMPLLLPLAAAAVGGYIGSHFGARRFSGLTLRRLLAFVLLLAAIKLIIEVLR
jgi:uncharacterized protein